MAPALVWTAGLALPAIHVHQVFLESSVTYVAQTNLTAVDRAIVDPKANACVIRDSVALTAVHALERMDLQVVMCHAQQRKPAVVPDIVSQTAPACATQHSIAAKYSML